MLCGIAVNERGAILTDRPDHIFDLQRMTPDGKCSRILRCGGTCRSTGGALLATSTIGANLLAIIPSQMEIAQAVIFDHRRSLVAVHFDASTRSRIGTG